MISTLSAWIMSIAGIICLSILVELILPNGQMNKYVKGIFSFIIILVIISPIPSLIGKQVNFDGLFNDGQIEVQEDYLYQFNVDKVSAWQKSINSQAQEMGYQNVDARVDCDIFSSQINIRAVYVDLTRLIISESAVHKDITEVKKDLLAVVTGIVDVEKQRVVFNE